MTSLCQVSCFVIKLSAPQLKLHNNPSTMAPAILVDRKSTRLNSSHVRISYAVFCLKKKISEIMLQMLTQAQTAGQYFTNDQLKEMTRKVSAEVDLVHQQTQNQRYGSSHIGATAKDISIVVTDAASGVVDIFHGIDKAVADTWNNFCKDVFFLIIRPPPSSTLFPYTTLFR